MTRSVLLMLALAFTACRNTGPENNPSGPWAPTTHPFDPTCASCTQIGSGTLAHGGDARLLIDATTDDPAAQWGRCFMSFLRCADSGGEYPTCVGAALCPDACKTEFTRALGPATGFDAEAAAVEAVFITPGALCAPPNENPEVSP